MPYAQIIPPFDTFPDVDGEPLEDGFIYIGVAGLDPTIIANRIGVFSNLALTVPVAQPIRTLGGFPVTGMSPIKIYTDTADVPYSITVLNKNGTLVYSSLSETGGPDVSNFNVQFADVETMKDSSLEAGQVVQTESYYAYTALIPAGGGASYQILTLAQWQTLTGATTPDGYGDHVLANGNVAMLVGKPEDVRVYGVISSDLDQTTIIQAMFNRVNSTSGGRVFNFPPGDYLVNTISLAGKFGITITGGASSAFTVIKVTEEITCNNTGDLRVFGIKFVGDTYSLSTRTSGAPTSGNYCFNMLDNCAHWDIYSCDFVGFDVVFRPDPAAASTGSYVINIHDNYHTGNNYDCEGGLVLHWNMYANTFAETRISNMRLSRPGEVHYANNCHENGIYTMTSYNVDLYNVSNQSCKSLVINNTFHEFSGFKFTNVDGVQVFGNTTRIHSSADLNAVLINGATENVILGVNEFNGFQGGSDFATRGIYVTDTAANIIVSAGCKVYNYITALLTDSGQLMDIKGAELRGNTTAVWVQNQSAINRVNLVDCLLQGGVNAIQSTGNAARWSERGCNILGGAVTNTDGFLDQYNMTGVWTPAPASLTVVGTPTYTGTFTKIGNIYHMQASISSTTTTAATAGTTFFTGFPVNTSIDTTVQSVTTGGVQGAVGLVSADKAFVGGWTATPAIRLSFTLVRA